MKLFSFPPEIFTAHGLTYVAKSAPELLEDECCWLKEDQAPGGDWQTYRLSVRRLGVVHSMKVPRHQFLSHVAHGEGADFFRGVVDSLIASIDDEHN